VQRQIEETGYPVALRASSMLMHLEAIRAGTGRGVLPCYIGDGHPLLERLTPRIPEIAAEYRIIVHRDLRRSTCVRAVIDWMKRLFAEQRDVLQLADMLAEPDERVTINRRAGEITISFGGHTNQAAQFTRSVPDFVLKGRFADLVAGAVRRIIVEKIVQGSGLKSALKAAAGLGVGLPANVVVSLLRHEAPEIRAGGWYRPVICRHSAVARTAGRPRSCCGERSGLCPRPDGSERRPTNAAAAAPARDLCRSD
jgi:hypothetical protein